MSVQAGPIYKRYAANGLATYFPIPFKVMDAGDLQITLDGVLVTSGFTLGPLGGDSTSCTFTVAPVGSLLFQLVLPFQRLTDYQTNGDLLAITINNDLDRIWLALKQLIGSNDRALSTDITEPEGVAPLPLKAVRATKVLAFDADSNPIASSLTLEQLEQQPTLAMGAAAAAQESASAAQLSQSAAANSEMAANGYRALAEKWAEEAEDVPVEPGMFSAKHWAAKAMAALSGLLSRVTSLESKVLTSGVAQATTIGTAVDFTGIPAGAKRITVMLAGISTNGASVPLIRLGAGSVQTSGYLGSGGDFAAGGVAASAETTGVRLHGGWTSGVTLHGALTLCKLSGNTWVATGANARSDSGTCGASASSVTLSGDLDRLRLTTANGTDTFDAGSINIMWEL